MKYVIFRDFEGKPISNNVDLPIVRGTELNSKGDFIYLDNKAICRIGSLNALKHIAINEDGNGLERGDITYSIAYADRTKTWTETVTDDKGNEREVNHTARFTNDEWQMINTDYPDFITSDGMMFSNNFFNADINRLRELQQKLQ